jgi:hypothetical protein
MIAYHGGPFSGPTIAAGVWRKRHAMVSFARNEQIGIATEYASSFALDNGAFSLWKAGQRRSDWDSYYRWVEAWRNHPGFDFDHPGCDRRFRRRERRPSGRVAFFRRRSRLSSPRIARQTREACKQLSANGTRIERTHDPMSSPFTWSTASGRLYPTLSQGL